MESICEDIPGLWAFLVNLCVQYDSFGKHLERGGHEDCDPDFLYNVLTMFANDTRTGIMDEELLKEWKAQETTKDVSMYLH